MKPTFFPTPAKFQVWLAKHHRGEAELLVGFHKVDSGRPSITWPQAVDEALCFGWIDGVRRRIDDVSYCIRFTPRKAASTWSAINIRRVAVLTEEGRMKPAGRNAFAKRTAAKSRTYSYEQAEPARLSPEFEALLKSNARASSFLAVQMPSYRRRVLHWVATAKSEEVRMRRLRRLIELCEQGKTK